MITATHRTTTAARKRDQATLLEAEYYAARNARLDPTKTTGNITEYEACLWDAAASLKKAARLQDEYCATLPART